MGRLGAAAAVQSTGFYNIIQGNFHCYTQISRARKVSCSITQLLVQVTGYNDGLAMDWLGLASVGTSEIYKWR